MSKYTRFSRNVFKICDAVCEPLCNWFRQSSKGLSVTLDVKYGEKKNQDGDIYFLSELENEKKPVLINIHGGGFVGGDKSCRDALSIWYANMGYFVYNINYGLAPERMFPEGPSDCVRALNWIVDNAERFNLDTTKIVVDGDSAGGYMASAVAAAYYSEQLQKCYGIAPKVKPCAVVLLSGIFDLETVLSSRVIFDMAPKLALDFCGVTIENIHKSEHHACFSTLDHVKSGFPKSFIAYAKRDMFVQGQGEALVARLQECGVYEEHFEAKRFGDNHCFALFWNKRSAKECNAKLKEFLLNIRDDKI